MLYRDLTHLLNTPYASQVQRQHYSPMQRRPPRNEACLFLHTVNQRTSFSTPSRRVHRSLPRLPSLNSSIRSANYGRSPRTHESNALFVLRPTAKTLRIHMPRVSSTLTRTPYEAAHPQPRLF